MSLEHTWTQGEIKTHVDQTHKMKLTKTIQGEFQDKNKKQNSLSDTIRYNLNHNRIKKNPGGLHHWRE